MGGAAAIVRQHGDSDLLRLLTCGSVDDGKSTLIGRLLHDSKTLYDDTLASLARDSRRVGSAGAAIDFSLLLDGLEAERAQGITIDVAYRYFSTPRRKFIIADCPGHEQYTRNMVTGASTANLAIVLVDAQKGVLPQTRRHSFIASLLDIGHVVVAVNKMDLVGWSEARFDEIRAAYVDFAARLQIRDIHFLPISALHGDNVVDPSANMPWYRGAPLLEHLETLHVAGDQNLVDLRFPVQLALRPDMSFRGYAGTVASGIVRPGDELLVLPSRRRTRVRSVVTPQGERAEAFAPMSVAITTADEIDIGRGDMLVHPNNQPRVGQELEAVIVWMSETALDPARTYVIKHTTREAHAEVTTLRYRFDIETLHRVPAAALGLNEIGRARIRVSLPLAFDAYRRNRATGSFILIDPVSHGTVAAGMILDHVGDDELDGRRPPRGPVERPASRVGADERAARLGQRPATVWLTGPERTEASSVAYAVERRLFDAGYVVHVLDGDNLASEDVRRAAQVARLGNDAGLITIVALGARGEADRAAARAIVGDERFVEVDVATREHDVDEAARQVVEALTSRGFLRP